MKVLLLSAQTNNDWVEGAEYALVEMTPEKVKGLLEKIALASGISKVDRNLLSLEFWDWDTRWASCHEGLEEILLGRQYAILDKQPEDIELVECECGTVHVYVDSVAWRTTVRHTSVYVESASLSRGALQAILDCTN